MEDPVGSVTHANWAGAAWPKVPPLAEAVVANPWNGRHHNDAIDSKAPSRCGRQVEGEKSWRKRGERVEASREESSGLVEDMMMQCSHSVVALGWVEAGGAEAKQPHSLRLARTHARTHHERARKHMT